MSSSLAEAAPKSGLAFAADIRILLKERPISIGAMRRRLKDQGDGRRALLAEYSGRVAPEALLAIAATEVVISPNINRVDHAAKLRYLAATCSETGRPRRDVTPGLELEWIELTIGAVEDVIAQLVNKRHCSTGRKQRIREYERLLTELCRLVERLQAA